MTNSKQPRLSALFWRLLFALALVAVALLTDARATERSCEQDSWIFARSRYSHDPDTGVRVAQYAMKPPVEPLPDARQVTSGYSRTRTVLRGPDGSANTTYRVQNFGNGRGELNAQWERFHDAWRGSTIAGGTYQGYQPYGYGYGYGGGYGGYGGGYGSGGYGGGYGGGGYGGGGYGGYGNGYGYGTPAYQRLDPDASDGYPEPRRRVPNRAFFGRDFLPGHGFPDHDGEDHDHGHHDQDQHGQQ